MDRTTRRELLERLTRDAERLASAFGLEYRRIEAERANVTSRYGVCYSDGTIKIRLRHARSGKPLKYSSLVNTLCHELAHLRHFDHGPRFKAFYLRILEHARSCGIYRPAPRVVAAPVPARLPLRPAVPAVASRPAAVARKPDRPAGPRQLDLFA